MSRKFHITSLDIFDALMAKGRRIGVSGLVDMAKQKGILVSHDEGKEVLADYVSQLPFDYDDIVNLYEIIEQDTRREKVTASQIKKVLTYEQLRASVDSVSANSVNNGEVLRVLTNPNAPSFIIEYEYKEVDFGKATMLQEVIRRDRVEFLSGKMGNTDVRAIANDKCRELVQKIIQEIERAEKERLSVDEIELSHVADGKKRNTFFFSLINGIEGMSLDDVSGVKISRMDGDDFLEENGDGEAVATKALEGFIREVAIKGRAILSQKAYRDFVDRGFFISNLTWRALDASADPNLLVEFEAGFSEPQQCTGFQYAVKGAYVFKKDESAFSATRRKLSEADKLRYKSRLEAAARQSKQDASHE